MQLIVQHRDQDVVCKFIASGARTVVQGRVEFIGDGGILGDTFFVCSIAQIEMHSNELIRAVLPRNF